MRVDWSSAEVHPARGGGELTLRVELVDIPPGGSAYDDAFHAEAGTWARSLGDERRNVERYSTGSIGGSARWGIEVSPINADDVETERRLLKEFVERVDAKAAPEHAKQEAVRRKKRAEAEALEKRAEKLTDEFRQG
jgi:hypothetical protein